MKGVAVHYKNKYPGAIVQQSDDALDVFVGDDHKVAIRKNGAGQFVCVSEEHGCSEQHDLSPIPKDARVHKMVDGKIGFDEKAAERKTKRESFMKGDKVLSCEELEKQGWSFDEKQRVTSAPQKRVPAPRGGAAQE